MTTKRTRAASASAPASARRAAPPTLRELFDREERDAMGHMLSRRQLVVRRGEQMTVGFDLWQPEAEELLDGPSYGMAA